MRLERGGGGGRSRVEGEGGVVFRHMTWLQEPDGRLRTALRVPRKDGDRCLDVELGSCDQDEGIMHVLLYII